MAVHVSKSFFQYILTSFPFPASIVQTDNNAVFAHWHTAGPKAPLDRFGKAHLLALPVNASKPLTASFPVGSLASMGKVERSHQNDVEEFYRLQRYQRRQDLEKAFYRWLWHQNDTRLLRGSLSAETVEKPFSIVNGCF